MPATMTDMAVLALAAFVGNAGVAVTGFGMAIIYWLVIQVADACGYPVDVKFAIFLQALSLLAAQPLLVNNANPRKYAKRSLMQLFIPVTVISTPIGQLVGDYVDAKWIQLSAGVLVLGMSTFEIYRNRMLIKSALCAAAPEVKTRDTSPDKATYVGDYRVLEQLGSGTQAIVKLAEHKKTKEQFAIKIIQKAKCLGGSEAAAVADDKIRKEAELQQALSHPNIISLEEVIETDHCWYFVMELVSGGELFDRLADDGAYDEATARQIMRQLLEAIYHVHSKGVMHRDLKPENIMLAEAPESAETLPVVKIADFGLAKLVGQSGRAATFCGTPNYCAPEVFDSSGDVVGGYKNACDMWSLGVICYNLLAGFNPFDNQCSDPPLVEQVRRGLYNFDHPVFDGVSEAAKRFINALLQVDPAKRLDAPGALAHEWLMTSPSAALSQPKHSGQYKSKKFDTTGPVFFMIGSQRSGSNWLRTMLDEREDLASPHPPHIMRDIMPILDKFGDLDDLERLRVLIDHVCTFVERNQVTWDTIHGHPIKFSRKAAESFVMEKLSLLREKAADDEGTLPKGMHLLAVFDFIYSEYTNAHDKRFWMCKSMGMSKYHSLLLKYYGEHRLRYIYLVRDPRDVAMSFMKTPVGDCHFYPILKKWCGLQDAVLPILDSHPQLLFKVHYEELLADKKAAVGKIYEFIGKRRFGMGQRKCSVLGLEDVGELIGKAKLGRQASNARTLSYQFKNLGRGESFAAQQHQKWLNGDEPLSESDLILIESIAHDHMVRLGYKPHLVPHARKPLAFTEEEITEFKRLNELAIQGMMATLEVENPGDAARRKRQAEVLSLPAEMISKAEQVCLDIGDEDGTEKTYMHEWPKGAERHGYLLQEEVAARLTMQKHETTCSDGTTICWVALSQRGYYPLDFTNLKKNQDAFDLQANIGGVEGRHWAAVFDGHGPTGDLCSRFAKVGVLKEFESAIRHGDVASVALRNAHTAVNLALHGDATINDDMAGTTSTCMYLDGENMYLANLGDSVCMIGKRLADGLGTVSRALEAKVLTKEHTLSDPAESKRIEATGGRVVTESQIDGRVDADDGSTDDGEQLRVYSADSKTPGTAFSRSIGDALAESLGVIAEPDISHHRLREEDRVIVLCSDGITDFVPPDEVMEVCSLYRDPTEACRALVGEAYKRWIRSEDRTDDITVVVGFRQSQNKDAAMPATAKSTALTTKGKAWTLAMGFLSGFLGGLCGIRGPPIIMYFLHSPLQMSKKEQKGNGAAITAANVLVRVIVYAFKSALDEGHSQFESGDLPLYLVVLIASVGGVAVGQDIFQVLKDSQATIKTMLCFLLLLCGISLVLATAM